MKKGEEIFRNGEAVQLNMRVPGVWRKALKMVALDTGQSIERVVLDAYAWFYDQQDDALTKRRKQYVESFQRIFAGKDLPFESPLDSRLDLHGVLQAVTMPRGGHDNGIVGVPSSILGGSTNRTGNDKPRSGFRQPERGEIRQDARTDAECQDPP